MIEIGGDDDNDLWRREDNEADGMSTDANELRELEE